MPYRDHANALSEQVNALERDLAASRHELERTTRARSLPLLDEVRVASPCNASWEAMEGDAKVRFCGECKKNVYNLSSLTRDQAEQLVREKEGQLCVRFYRRADGTLLTADCPVGVRRLRFRRACLAAIGFGVLTLGAFLAVAATRPTTMMGDIRPVPIHHPDVEQGRIALRPPVPPAPAYQRSHRAVDDQVRRGPKR